MTIFIPSRGRAETISTHKLWPDGSEDYYVVVHSEKERDEYNSKAEIPLDRILVTNLRPGMGTTRNWIHNKQNDADEMFMCMDDNIKSITAFPRPYYDQDAIDEETLKQQKDAMLSAISWGDFKALLEGTIDEAKRREAYLIGFATVNNPFFRGKKYRDVGFVIGQMYVAWNKGIVIDPNIIYKEDYAFTAEYLAKFGNVLINNYIWPNKKHYEQGGCGSLESRTPALVSASQILMDKYPGLFRFNDKNKYHPKAELVLRYHSREQITKWRDALLVKS